MIRAGRFELRGCDPDKARRVYFLDAENQLGATVDLVAAKAQRDPLTVHLLPCGSATIRFVDQDGHPWINTKVSVSAYLIFAKTPVDPFYGSTHDLDWWMKPLDPRRYGNLRTDAKGRVTFPTLIPGAPYLLKFRYGKGKEKKIDVTVKPGQTLDLGEFTVKRSK